MDFRAPTAIGAVSALLAAVVLLAGGGGHPARAASIDGLVGQLNAPLQATLSEAIAEDTRRIGALQPDINRLGGQLDRLQSNIDVAQHQLVQTQDELQTARSRLVLLQAALRRDEAVLARQLVALYEAGSQDWTTVVLNAKGFTDLLERANFQQRLAHRNALVVKKVRSDRAAVKRAEARLQVLEVSQARELNTLVQARRRIAVVYDQLVARKNRLVGSRKHLRAKLSKVAGAASEALQAAGLTTFSGIPVAAWIQPILVYAAGHGWNGHLVQYDGFRTYGDQQAVAGTADVAAAPGRSRHEGTQWPDGAIDIPEGAAGFNAIVNGPGSPYRGQLQWRAPEGDPVHFSSPTPVAGKGY
jgi:peptidoglycan hydrolase CwlO-like protein